MPHVGEVSAEQVLLGVVRELLAELGLVRSFTLDSSLERDLGLGSLERVELLSRLEAEFRVQLPDAAMADASTVGDLLRALLAAEGRPVPERLESAEISVGPLEPPHSAANLLEVLYQHSSSHPQRPHVLLPQEDGSEQTITFGSLSDRACRVAADLRRRGVGAGDRVALMLPTGEEFFYTFMGVLLAQAIPVPLYPPFRADRIEDFALRQAGILRNADAMMMVTTGRGESLGKLLRPAAPSLQDVVGAERLGEGQAARWPALPRGGDLPALIQYTSGSTGDPKGVLLTHANLLANIRAVGQAIEAKPDDIAVSWLPLYHDMGLIGCWLLSMYFGIPITILSPLAFLSRPERWLWTIHYRRATLSVGPNFAYDLCARKIRDEALEGLDLRCWRMALNGSEPVRPDTVERFTTRFARYGFRPETMLPVYGLAEGSLGVSVPPLGRRPRMDRIRREPFEREGRAEPSSEPADPAFASVGCALEGHEVRIVDEAGRPAGERVQGRVQFRGPSSMAGYFRRPDATAAIRHGDWLDSGDLGYWAEGELFLCGRSKDIILKAGRNLHPHEIEAAVAEVEGVRKGCVAAFGVADPAQGTEKLVLAVETRQQDPGARERLRSVITQRVVDLVGLPPDDVVFLAPGALEKTSSGKLRRAACRDEYASGTLAARRPSPVMQWLRLAARWLPAMLAHGARAVRRALYAVYFYPAFFGVVLGCWVVLLLMPLGKRSTRVMCWFSRLALRVAGIRVEPEGLENLPGQPAIFVANHASYLDPLMLMAALPLPLLFVVKREAQGIPLFGTILRRSRHLLVIRGDAAQSVAETRRVVEALENGDSVMVFAEGTFTRARGLRPFKLGAFQAAAEAGCPVVPAALRGSRYVLPDDAFLPRPAPVRVTLRPPIWARGREWREMIRLRDAAFSEILAHCGEPRLEVVSAGLPGQGE